MAEEIRHEDRLHAKFSPSSLENRELCPGWNDDSNAESIYATDGTHCHEACEALLNGDPIPQINLRSDLNFFVQECFDYIAPRIAGAELIVTEKRLYHKNPLLRELSHGTPDVYAITGNEAQLFDEKYGRRPVEHASTNLQGWTYVLALFDTYEKLEKITMHFCVPRVHKCTSNYTFTRAKDYDRMLARVLRTVERAQANRTEDYRASWSACAYCARKSTCSVLGLAIESAYDLATDAISAVRIGEAVQSETPENLGFLNNAAKVIEDWSKQTQERVKMMAMSGHEVTGYELRFAKGRTTVKPVGQVIKAGIEIPIDKVIEHATIPLVELRKIYTSGVPPIDKEDKEKELMQKLARGGALKSGEDSAYLYRSNENK